MSISTSRQLSRNLPEVRQERLFSFCNVYLFVAGASVAVDVPIMGRVFGPDVLCSIGLLVLLMGRSGRNATREMNLVLVVVAVWLFGAIMTDLIKATAFEDLVRGWSKIFFFTITFVFLYLATEGKLLRITLFLLGLGVGDLLTLAHQQDDFFLAEPWKFGFGPPITLFIMVFISTLSFRRLVGLWGQVAVIAALASLNLVLNSRSVFGLLLASASIGALAEVLGWFLRGKRLPKPVFAATLVGAFVFCQSVASVYGWAASSGILGPEALEKYEVQTQGGMGILLGGRAESLVSTQAIMDSPIIGHGSWARDYSYVSLYIQALEQRGVPIIGDPYSSGLIPSHSFLLGSWVEFGILGAIFWIYVLALCGRALYSLFHIPDWCRPFVTFVLLSLMWDVLFSPFGAQQRFLVPAEMCIVFWVIRNQHFEVWFRRSNGVVA